MVSAILGIILLYFAVTNAVPIPQRLVDMTYVFDDTTISFPTVTPFGTKVIHNGTVGNSTWFSLYYEDYSSGTHAGTHMEAPAHFYPEEAPTIDKIPLSSLMGPAAVVDITARSAVDPDAVLEIQDLWDWEHKAGRSLDGHIVLVRSGWGKYWGNRAWYLGTATEDPKQMHHPGISPKAAWWLTTDRKVLGVGIDTVSVDNNKFDGYSAHRTILAQGMYLLENVANMEQVPMAGAQLAVLPMKIGKGSAAPVRIVASVPMVAPMPSEAADDRDLWQGALMSRAVRYSDAAVVLL